MQEKTSTGPDPYDTGHPGQGPGPAGPGPVRPVIPAAAAKRANASVIGMIVALVVSIAAFLPVILMNPAPKSDGYHPDIDVSAVARNATDVAGFTPVAPDTGGAFTSNYARWESGSGSGVPTWEVGFLTPKQSFIGLVQTRQPNPTWLVQQTKSAPVTGKRSAGGQEWELRDTGKGERSMVLQYRGTTVVLTGSAQLDEFAELGAAVVKSMEASPAATDSPSPAPAP
ncbi:MAG TPA: DUF4245 domain-containing protein [Arthrobacter sp.]